MVSRNYKVGIITGYFLGGAGSMAFVGNLTMAAIYLVVFALFVWLDWHMGYVKAG